MTATGFVPPVGGSKDTSPYRLLADPDEKAPSPPPSKETLEAFRKAAWLQPEEADFHFILGEALLQAGRPVEAAVAFEEAAWANPADGQYQICLGTALRAAGRIGDAVSAFREAVRLLPRDIRAINGLGVCLLALGQTGEGVRTLRQAAAMPGDSPDIHFNLGLALVAAGATEEAVAPLRRAADLRREDAAIQIELGAALHELGRDSEALSAIREGLRIDPHRLDDRPLVKAAYEALAASQIREGLRTELGLEPRRRPWAALPLFMLVDHLPSLPRRVGGVLILLLLPYIAVATVRVSRPFFTHYAFQDEVAEIAHMPVRDDDAVLGRLMNAVERHALGDRIRARQFTIDTRQTYRRIRCAYDVPVPIWPGFTRSVHFAIDVDRPVLIPDEVDIH